ncbi:hypothetical protein ACJX0J_036815, partial [Zea mays]
LLWLKALPQSTWKNTLPPPQHILDFLVLVEVGLVNRGPTFAMAKEVLLSGGAACHWYFNPSIEEVEAFYSRIESEKVNIEFPSNDEQEIASPTFPQQEHHDPKYILPLNPDDVSDQGYECTVTITCILEGKTWYYIACNTFPKKPSIDPIIRQCSTRGSTDYFFRYKLTFKASDGTEEAEINVCETISNSCFSFLVHQLSPPEIAAIVSQKYTLIVEFNSQLMTSLPRAQGKEDVHLPLTLAEDILITTVVQSSSTPMSRHSMMDLPS